MKNKSAKFVENRDVAHEARCASAIRERRLREVMLSAPEFEPRPLDPSRYRK